MLKRSTFTHVRGVSCYCMHSGALVPHIRFSCLFFYLGDMERDENNYWADGVGLNGNDDTTNYIAACYWSIMTLTTVGYGDISAQTDAQRILGVITMIAGALFYAYGVSHVVSIVDEVRAETRAFKGRMDRFNSYMSARNLPQALRGDIREFLHNKRRRQKASIRDEEHLLSQLSMGLRSRVAMAINEQYLKEMPFFLGADVNLTMELALNMESIFFPAYEDVVREGEEGDAMYFIVAGSVEVLVGQTHARVAVLIEKQYFGEAALLMPEGSRRRTATVRTLQFSEFRLLRAQDFVRILQDYPHTRQQIEQLAQTRMRVLEKKSKGGSASDRAKQNSKVQGSEGPEDEPAGSDAQPKKRKHVSRRLEAELRERTSHSNEAANALAGKTLMDSLGSMDPSSIVNALEATEDKNNKIQQHVMAIQMAQDETQRRLSEIHSFIHEIRSNQNRVRRESLNQQLALKHRRDSEAASRAKEISERAAKAQEEEDDEDVDDDGQEDLTSAKTQNDGEQDSAETGKRPAAVEPAKASEITEAERLGTTHVDSDT